MQKLLHPLCQLLFVVKTNNFQVNGSDMYDVVNSGNSGVSVLALRNLWDQKHGLSCQERDKRPPTQHLNDLHPPPVLPPKCENRKLTGAVSIDTVFLARVRWASFVLITLSNTVKNHCWKGAFHRELLEDICAF